MDHDAMHRDVQGLKKFQTRVEKVIAFVEYVQKLGLTAEKLAALADAHADVNQPGAVGMSDADRQMSKVTLDGFADRLSKLESTFAESGQDGKLAERVAKLESAALAAADTGGGFEERLSALEVSKAEGESFSERLMNVLTWFEANQEGLELLLSLDGDPDAPDTPILGAQADAGASGAASGSSGTADTGPAPDAPVAELSNDPSAVAEKAVAEPTAGTDKV